MLVPKASMDHDYGLMPGEHDVGSPREIFLVKPEAVAKAMQHFPYSDFWAGTFLFDATHNSAALVFRHKVRHFNYLVLEARRKTDLSLAGLRFGHLHNGNRPNVVLMLVLALPWFVHLL